MRRLQLLEKGKLELWQTGPMWARVSMMGTAQTLGSLLSPAKQKESGLKRNCMTQWSFALILSALGTASANTGPKETGHDKYLKGDFTFGKQLAWYF